MLQICMTLSMLITCLFDLQRRALAGIRVIALVYC